VVSDWQHHAAPLASILRMAVMGINATDGVFMAEQPAQNLSYGHNGHLPQYGQLTIIVRMDLPHRRQV